MAQHIARMEKSISEVKFRPFVNVLIESASSRKQQFTAQVLIDTAEVMVIAQVMVTAHVWVTAQVMVIAQVIVIAQVMVVAQVMLIAQVMIIEQVMATAQVMVIAQVMVTNRSLRGGHGTDNKAKESVEAICHHGNYVKCKLISQRYSSPKQ